MARLNDRAAAAMLAHGVHGATDVTGYGLVGHAGEMARASGVALAIDAARVPLLAGVLELIEQGVVPGGSRENLADHARFAQYGDGVEHGTADGALGRPDLGRPADRDPARRRRARAGRAGRPGTVR